MGMDMGMGNNEYLVRRHGFGLIASLLIDELFRLN